MPISDLYAVQCILDGTQSEDPRILWKEQISDGNGYITQIGDVEFHLQQCHSRSGSRLVLNIMDSQDEFCLHEPIAIGWFGRKYGSENERCLAELLQKLMRAVSVQCNNRRERAIYHPEQVKERLYRRLLFEPATLQERKT